MNFGFIHNSSAIGFGVISDIKNFYGDTAAPQSATTSLLGQSFMRLVLRARDHFRLSVRCLAQAKGICPIFLLG